METKNRLENALREAIRANDELSKRTIRMALANVRNAEIDKGSILDETAVLLILQKEVKSRNESIADARKADRFDLIEVAEMEKKILEEFLPGAMNENELRELIGSTITELAANDTSDLGKVIKSVIGKTQGRATGEQVSRIAREFLQKLQ